MNKIANKRIVIITDQPQKLMTSQYLIKTLLLLWKSWGANISVTDGSHLPPGDIAIMHVDQSQVPQRYFDIAKAYPVVLNGGFADNTKRAFSQNLLNQQDEYSGPVLVKTNANYGGIPEAMRDPLYRDNVIHDSSNPQNIDWSDVRAMNPSAYPVFNAKEDVPASVWSNPYLVVEKFLPEIDEHGHYKMRACFFMGRKFFGIVVSSPDQIIKGKNVIDRQLLLDVPPPAVREARVNLKVNFGRIDYVMRDGEAIIYDVNKTATLSEQAATEWQEHVVNLALGLEAFL